MTKKREVVAPEELQILICTANLGNAEPTKESMSAWVPPNGSTETLSTLGSDNSANGNKSNDKKYFDVISIGMQESTFTLKGTSTKEENAQDEAAPPAEDRDDDDLDEAAVKEAAEAEIEVVNKDNKDNTGTSSNREAEQITTTPATPKSKTPKRFSSKEGSSLLEGQDSILLKSMIQTILGGEEKYTLIIQQQRGQMRLFVFVRTELVSYFTDIKIKCENTGVAHVLANKGGIVAYMTYNNNFRLAFLTAHLAAHEGEQYYKTRCDNVREILRGTTYDGLHDAAVTSHVFFVCGDLNYRTKFIPQDDDNTIIEHDDKIKKAFDLIDNQNFETLYSYDELTQGIKNGEVLTNFNTLPCHFNPTFKVLRQGGFVYKEQRVPSYTDRVLWKCADGLDNYVKQWSYEPCKDFITSDHKPIRGAFTVQTKPTSIQIDKLHLIFKNMEGKDLPGMDVDGLSDPYLKFILNPDDIRVKGGGRSSSAPATNYIAKTLNPKWPEEIDIVLKPGSITSDMLLYVTCMDFDATSKDDLMGTAVLNVQKLCELIGKNEQKFDLPLLKYGKLYGRLKFTLNVVPFDSSRRQMQRNTSFVQRAKSLVLGGFKKRKSKLNTNTTTTTNDNSTNNAAVDDEEEEQV